MSDKPQEPLNAAQLAEINRAIEGHLARAIEAMQLRKWAVEQAAKMAAPTTNPADMVKLAEGIYGFVSRESAIKSVASE